MQEYEENGDSLIEAISIIVGIFLIIGLLLSILSNNNRIKNESKPMSLKIGDMVYIDGLNITGKVSEVHMNNQIDFMTVGTNGTLQFQQLNAAVVTKIILPEK